MVDQPKPDTPPPMIKLPPGFGRIHDGYQDLTSGRNGRKNNGQDPLYAYKSVTEDTKARN
jgi:hypothetical protein